MNIKFDAVEVASSPLHNDGSRYCRPVIVMPQQVTTEQIAQKVSEECTLTPIDINAVIESVAHQLLRQLQQGNNVRVAGIGTFSLALKFEDPKLVPDAICSRDVKVTGINFAPDAALLSKLRSSVSFERTTFARSQVVTEAEAVLALRTYFSDHRLLKKSTFQHLLGLKYTRATTLLQSLVKKQKLEVSKIGPTNVYTPGPML